MRAKGLFITGTHTGVGKTRVTAIIGALLRKQGIDFGVSKPVHTGVKGRTCPDLEEYKRFFSLSDPDALVCPVRLKAPQAPTIASALEKSPVMIETIDTSLYILRQQHVNVLVEGIGGVLVPLTQKVTVADLIKRTGLFAVVVASPQLGTINHTCLTIEALRNRKVPIAGVVFNKVAVTSVVFDMIVQEITRMTRVPCLGYLGTHQKRMSTSGAIVRAALHTLQVKQIISFFKK
ncbi:MAG: dethiobiotin synthase [Candidatus Raymondbacteria bacterium RifOxyA12_full_50_37]|uniref:ATP-dependent dethiobiotin synthetase BioD n=1 Tax=Candidatus Raymondbacteria bacterium RIFOXYD12_FULL_49_13 TaxID=1817890 RepID=A0A1F7F280_UNCRA|nr:MAG: dethiobiotin synthase [Candidatus Raymondbacteria bacterium RifOxyA12_full_50_37]OGJ85542.1 MAG: dethiobiotin synthase [Candidatus Raymondbacteria bacterium RIFOXYA2_FULL_49_16]OGJ94676.1 MAG: dethiobiotin synthase [Candidatus Raymondbacteria bacterium RifOxyC12_full_50_8]OGJ95045.1 MAG: dethiobiotin synthase [Candidatus Raymondbacteria bacterium RIFOXYC2_FULL_50_21]OGK00708.1 MAG: dethiobiotin synthase [Candidatus Raymondbacteria bacterium RIFOXYD12_FULL_49_13]OGK04461.1 MAG: dethiobi